MGRLEKRIFSSIFKEQIIHVRNPARRNRNIGTSRQGHGQNNRAVIPFRNVIVKKKFYERLKDYKVVRKTINGKKFRFVVEKTRKNIYHCCTVDDMVRVIRHLPMEDFGDLRLIILRQPTRKEEQLNPVFGRLIYSYEFEKDFEPAIIIEAVDLSKPFKLSKKLSLDERKELERLKKDGLQIWEDKRYYRAEYDLDTLRNIQLYRTLLHEFGHYVQYYNNVLRPLVPLKQKMEALETLPATQENNDKWLVAMDAYHNAISKREDTYFQFPKRELEVFAENYAEKLRHRLEQKGIIPFERIVDFNQMRKDGLNPADFVPEEIIM